jgi:hypothetical protein
VPVSKLAAMESGEASREFGQPPAPGRLERFAPWACATLGVLMIVAAAIGYLESAVSVAFVIVGAALFVVGGFAARIEGTIKVGVQGFEVALRAHHEARQALVEAQREVQESDPEEAKRLGEKVEELDNWFEAYQAEVARRGPGLSPFTKATLLQLYHQGYRAGSAPTGADTQDRPSAFS